MARILIVDDDPDIVEAASLILGNVGHDVVSAFNRGEGMAALAQHQPDLLILDVMMEQPDDGISMAQEIRRAGNRLPILMMTSISRARGLSYDRDDELVPVDAFLEKPVDPAVLVERAQALLDKGPSAPSSQSEGASHAGQ